MPKVRGPSPATAGAGWLEARDEQTFRGDVDVPIVAIKSYVLNITHLFLICIVDHDFTMRIMHQVAHPVV